VLEVDADDARRLALAAQGLTKPRPKKPTAAHVTATATQLQAIQIDSVNVLVRAHYLPLFTRLGPYPMVALDRLTNERHDLVELRHGHQASYVPVDVEPLLRWKLDDGRNEWRKRWRANVDEGYVDAVLDQVRERGPLALGDLDDARRRAKQAPHELTIRRKDGQPYAESSLRWGRPSDGKTVLDGLLHEGVLALAGRRGAGFDRLYDLSERVLPEPIRNAPTPAPVDARRELVRRAAVNLGVASVADLADYFQLKTTDAKVAVDDLVAAGDLEVVRVEGWKGPAYRDARAPRPKPAADDDVRLLGPFDSLTWSRDRTRRIFGFDFSFEIYVPEAKRKYGYYVLPVLLGGRLVGRVDLKADRARRALVAVGAFTEPTADAKAVAAPLEAELHRLARWLDLETVELPRGYGRRP
jgi:hypothetical protein